MKKIFVFFMIITCLLCFVACGTTKKEENIKEEDVTQTTYTITYNVPDGIEIESTSQTVKKGENFTLYTPTREGNYIFLGWYLEGDNSLVVGGVYNYNKNITIFAKWKIDNSEWGSVN